jgi:hypothetical protein
MFCELSLLHVDLLIGDGQVVLGLAQPRLDQELLLHYLFELLLTLALYLLEFNLASYLLSF